MASPQDESLHTKYPMFDARLAVPVPNLLMSVLTTDAIAAYHNNIHGSNTLLIEL